MNYTKIYDSLISRAKLRVLDGYGEYHHIVPRCMGGTDDPSNIIHLTPEEHYLAHQLLIKIYPGNEKLVYAAHMMVAKRPCNKMYGWLKRKFADSIRKNQTGNGNSQFGTKWIFNDTLKESKKIGKNEQIPEGWSLGRKLIFDVRRTCEYCNTEFSPKGLEMFCSRRCKHHYNSPAIKLIDDNLEDMIEKFKNTKSIDAVLKSYGLGGRQGNKYFSEVLKSKGFEVLKRRNS